MSNTLKFGNGKWAVKKGSTLAYNDEGGNFKPLPFTFDRSTSATRVNKDGLIEVVSNNEPRIDFLNDSKGALKLEPSRTNLVTYSEDFANSSVWGAVNTTFTDNETQSPSGLLTGKLTRNVTTFSCIRDATVSTVLGTTYVFSAFYKKDTETTINHGVLNQTTGYVTFNFDTETISITRNDNSDTISTDGFGFEKYANGWYRVYLKFVRKAGSFQAQVARQDSGVIGQSTFIYGAQVEQGSYATSYIPTQGSIGTRVAESCSQTPPSGIIGQTEGTVYAEFDYLNSTGERRYIFQFGAGGNTLYARIESGQTLTSQILNSASGLTTTGTALPIGINKLAIAYASNDAVIYLNGVQIAITNSIVIPTLNNFYINSNAIGSEQLAGINKEFKLYNTRLSNTELQALTS